MTGEDIEAVHGDRSASDVDRQCASEDCRRARKMQSLLRIPNQHRQGRKGI